MSLIFFLEEPLVVDFTLWAEALRQEILVGGLMDTMGHYSPKGHNIWDWRNDAYACQH